MLVNEVDVKPRALSLTEASSYYYRDGRYRPETCVWEKPISKLLALPGILNLDERREETLSMEEITATVIAPPEGEEEVESTIPGLHLIKKNSEIHAEPDYDAVYIKLLITETDDILLYESPSLTVLKEVLEEGKTEEAKVVESKTADDQVEVRRRFADAEAQTQTILYKTKAANTDRIKKVNQSSFVSNYDMWDTYAELATTTKEIDVGDDQIEITTFSRNGMEDIDEVLKGNLKFRQASMVLERLLAANIFGERQKRFRNFRPPDPFNRRVQYLYRLEPLWTYKNPELVGKAVASFSFCTRNGDILAVAYGVYGFATHEYRNVGYVCIWNIKNPVNPERRYQYKAPVTAVAFSKNSPQLLAIGLYNGRVEIRDITVQDDSVVAESDRKTSPGYEPIMQIEWVEGKA